MKKLLIVLIPSLLTTACAPAMYGMAALSARSRHAEHRYERPAEPSPVGRWDNVMMLEPGTPLKVLTMDGTVITGNFITANNRTLRLDTPNIEALAMTDVMRVDRLGAPSKTVVREGAKGAALGAGVVGVAGLMLGVAPPPRVFAGGAILGGYMGAADAAGAPGRGTIYVASSPASPGRDSDLLAARSATQRFTATVTANSAPDRSSHAGVARHVGEGMLHTASPYTTMPTIQSRASR